MRFTPLIILVAASARPEITRTAAFIGVRRSYNALKQQRSLSYVRPTIPVCMMAGDGIVCASKDSIRAAMNDPRTTILDVRGVDEIVKDGYLNPKGLQYIHSQCTKDDAPMLSIAAEDMIRDKDAPVLVYCALGFRASKAKSVLESKGYTNVLLGGGLSDLDFLKE